MLFSEEASTFPSLSFEPKSAELQKVFVKVLLYERKCKVPEGNPGTYKRLASVFYQIDAFFTDLVANKNVKKLFYTTKQTLKLSTISTTLLSWHPSNPREMSSSLWMAYTNSSSHQDFMSLN